MEANLYWLPSHDRLVLDINGHEFHERDGRWHRVLDAGHQYLTLAAVLARYGVLDEILAEQGKARPELVELFKEGE